MSLPSTNGKTCDPWNSKVPSCPNFLSLFSIRNRERLAEIHRVKWTGNKPVCTKQRTKQTDWPINYSNPLHHFHHPLQIYTNRDTRSRLFSTSLEDKWKDVGSYLPAVAASVLPVCLRLSVCIFPDCVPLCHCIEKGGRRGEAASHVIQMFQSPASQRPTVAQLKEALCEGQTDGHRMKTVMIPSTAQHTHTHTYALAYILHSLRDVMVCASVW